MNQTTDTPFVISRTFNAPRELVWRAFTEGDRMAQWWGPKGFIMRKSSLDLRPGGLYHYGMESPQGQTMWGRFVFQDIDPMDLLSFVVSFSDEDAGMTRHPMAPDWPLEMLSTVRFIDEGDRTTLKMESIPVNASEAERAAFQAGFKSMEGGFAGTLDQLEAYLAEHAG